MMAAIKENQKLNQPAYRIERPRGSSRTSQADPLVGPTPLILLCESDLYHMRKEYGDDKLQG